jgi:microcystin-dependent protein
MPTTSFVDFTAAVRGISDRTNSAGTDVTDYSAEEDRLAQADMTPGALSGDAFIVKPDTGMNVKVGSGAAKADLYAVEGTVAGQGVYITRLDQAPVTVTISPADSAQARTDQVWLIVADAAYDGGAVSLPRFGYRKGDVGAGAPGPDSAWKAAALLATITVPAGAASISASNITDARVFASSRARPIGEVTMFFGVDAPTGWLLCQGQAVSRTTYAALFREIGTAAGAGNGSTTFNIPDLRDRVPVGVSGTKARGTTGGVDSVTLAVTNLPSHTHAGPSHVHTGPSHTHAGPSHTHAGPSHTHTGPSHVHAGPSHSHSINHDHSAFTTASGGTHDHVTQHNSADGTSSNIIKNGSISGYVASDTNQIVAGGEHTHSIDVPNFSGTSGAGGTGDTGSASGTTGSASGTTGSGGTGDTGLGGTGDTGSASGTTGATGSGTAVNIQNKFMALHFMIRATW